MNSPDGEEDFPGRLLHQVSVKVWQIHDFTSDFGVIVDILLPYLCDNSRVGIIKADLMVFFVWFMNKL